MPTVTTYGQRKVGTAALPGARLTAAETQESTGAEYQRTVGAAAQAEGAAKQRSALAWAGTAETVGKVAQQGMAIEIDKVQKATDEAHQQTAMRAQTDLARRANAIVLETQTKRGEQAKGAPEEASAAYQKAYAEIYESLPTDKDKLAFEKYGLQTSVTVDSQVMRHTASELQKATDAALIANVEAQVNTGALAASDPRMIKDLPRIAGGAVKLAGENAKAVVAARGGGEVEQNNAQQKAQSAVHVGVVQQLLATNQTEQARHWYEEAHAAGQLTQEANKGLLDAIEAGSLRKEGQVAFDKIIATTDDPDERIKAARAIEDPKVRDDAEARVHQQNALDERAEKEKQAKNLNTAWGIIERGGSVDDIPPHLLAELEAHKPMLRAEQLRIAKGEPRLTNYGEWTTLMRDSRNNPAEFVKLDLLTFRDKLSDEHYEQLTQLQNQIANGQRSAALNTSADFATKSEVFDTTLMRYHMDPRAKNDTAQGQINAKLFELLDQEVNIRQSKNGGKQLSNEEVRSVLNRIITAEVQAKNTGLSAMFGSATYAKKVYQFTYEDIPGVDRERLQQSAINAGVNPTKEYLINAYQGEALFGRRDSEAPK